MNNNSIHYIKKSIIINLIDVKNNIVNSKNDESLISELDSLISFLKEKKELLEVYYE